MNIMHLSCVFPAPGYPGSSWKLVMNVLGICACRCPHRHGNCTGLRQWLDGDHFGAGIWAGTSSGMSMGACHSKNQPGRVTGNSPRLVRGMLCSLSFTCVAPGGKICMDVHTAPGIYYQLAPSSQLFEVVDIIFPSVARLSWKSKFTLIFGTLAAAYRPTLFLKPTKLPSALSRSPFKYFIALQSLKCHQSTHAAGLSWWPMCIVDYYRKVNLYLTKKEKRDTILIILLF